MLHDCIARDGKHLYPAMPYPSYTKMSQEDALAVKAYLLSLAPVQATIPENRISFPFNQRGAISFWNLLNNPGRRCPAGQRKVSGIQSGKPMGSARACSYRPAPVAICQLEMADSRHGRRSAVPTPRVILPVPI